MAVAFLSYALADQSVASEVQRALNGNGIDVTSGMTVPAGANVSKAVLDEMEGADAFVFLISKQFVKSQWTQIEVAAALAQVTAGEGKRVVPVLIGRDLNPREDVPPLLQRYSWVDLREGFDEQRLAPLVDALTDPAPPATIEDQLKAERELLTLRWWVQESDLAHARAEANAQFQLQRRREARVAVLIGLFGALLACLTALAATLLSDGFTDGGTLSVALTVSIAVNLVAVASVGVGIFRSDRGWLVPGWTDVKRGRRGRPD